MNGTNGVNGVSGYELVTSLAMNISNANPATQKAVCPAGKKAIGGGFAETTTNGMIVTSSGPSMTTLAGDSWSVTASRLSGNAQFTVTAICVSAL